MKINEILAKVKITYEVVFGVDFLDEIEVEDITIDSRKVKKNSVFFAEKGKEFDGNLFISESIKKDVSVVVSADLETLHKIAKTLKDEKILLIFSQNSFQLMVEFLQIFFPKIPINIYAVTGTNGKTSVAEFIRQILKISGKKSASIGTLGVISDQLNQDQIQQNSLTTPDIISLYKNLAVLKENGVDDVSIEVSSIGLDQKRIAGLKISAAAFTNFSQDHLDYHQNMGDYFLCKMLLFKDFMQPNDFAVINSDIVEYQKIVEICSKRNLQIIDYGFKAVGKESLRIEKIEKTDFGQKVFFEFLAEKYHFDLSIKGDFQVYNVVCALAMFLSKNKLAKNQLENLLKNFNQLQTAVGRMQIAGVLKNKAQIFIDFAHTPDALINVLELARRITKTKSSAKFSEKSSAKSQAKAEARIFILFGCGGDRDNKKRSIMGEIASKLADKVIITDDNPRTEDAEKIRCEILQGCDKSKTIEIADRKAAIERSILMLQDNDILILAGKGHEKYQIIGKEKFAFDEEKIVQDVINSIS
jgi:UDP-N-acetylmuramoyl-L-alanyl-D-glutamate--2,6-diaminopimelate ligase